MSGDLDVVRSYIDQHYRVVFWPQAGDAKGPSARGWPEKTYTLDDYREGYRVGILTGTEVSPGRYLHDVDIDWAPGSLIAQAMLPPTSFVFGRQSKRVSHCFYTTSEPIASYRYEDVDKTCLVELRGTKVDGDVGLQTMAPPSVWSKGALREPLTFVKSEGPSHVEMPTYLKQRVCLSAIAMLLAKHFGMNGFGHEPRLCWAGFLLRAGIGIDDLVLMGDAISRHCSNVETWDVRRTLESTAAALAHDGKKVKGGPALARLIGVHGKAVVARVNEWLGRDSDFVRVDGRIVAKNQENIRRAIELLGHELSYNEFADKMLVDGRPMEDREVNNILTRIEIEYKFQPPENYFERVIKFLAWSKPFHPVKDYLNSLTWDGVARIDRWLIVAAGAEDTPYVSAVGSIMLVAAVRRIKQPGCKYDEMVIWEGEQGSLKSSAAQALCTNYDWFSDDLQLNLKSQQLIEATLGKWIVEASDMAGKRKSEVEQLKAMLSRQRDGPARMAYAHFPVERPRHFIIIGTTNSTAYLVDPTGDRRFWPMAVGKFDVAWIVANRDQMWAEACVREAAGESIRLKEDLWPDAAEQQESRREVDPWEGVLREALLGIEATFDGRRKVAAQALWSVLQIAVEKQDRSSALRISDIMQRLGFKRTTVRVNGEEPQTGYVTVDATRLGIRDAESLDVREPGDEPPF